MRRSECLGSRESRFDFRFKFFSANHTVTTATIDKKKIYILPPVRFHDLRHSCIGLMMANGVPLERIRDWVGHSDIRTTANIYGHLEYQSKKKTAKIIEKSLPLKKVGAGNPLFISTAIYTGPVPSERAWRSPGDRGYRRCRK